MTLEQISKTVCDHFGIDHEHMIMKTGERYFTEEIEKINQKLMGLTEEPKAIDRLQSVIDRLDTGEITINQIKKELAEIAMLLKKR